MERYSIYLYKKLTKVAESKQLGESSTKFSIHLNKDYVQMLEEFASRTDTTRAEAARLLLSAALDEINDLYNLKNDENFDYSYTAEMEKVLEDEEIQQLVDRYNRKSDRLDELEFIKKIVLEGKSENFELQLNLIEKEQNEIKSELKEVGWIKDENS
jgi:anionic cell wall polymer biosynthesis LytR-Cps2A-Psr (LCP) family protein